MLTVELNKNTFLKKEQVESLEMFFRAIFRSHDVKNDFMILYLGNRVGFCHPIP